MYQGFVLIGRTGAGKTTVGSELASKLDVPFISSGSIARQIIDADSLAAREVKAGGYAPERAIRTEVTTQIESACASSGCFVIEGFPRKLPQLVIMESLGLQLRYIELVLPAVHCIRRLAMRGRDDDHADSIAAKFESYLRDTRPVLDALLECNMLWRLYSDMDTPIIVDAIIEDAKDAL